MTLSREAAEARAAEAATSGGFDEDFLGTAVPVPTLTSELAEDAVELDGSPVVPYTHFSLTLSRSRRLARWVAWNVDGANLMRISRDGVDFRLDERLPAEAQAGEDVYADNDLDRGHLARRADLVWGPEPEARQANEDSFHFTNIAPQINDFNQSSSGGVWGELENSLFDQVEVERLRISVVAGPVLQEDDRTYRGRGCRARSGRSSPGSRTVG